MCKMRNQPLCVALRDWEMKTTVGLLGEQALAFPRREPRSHLLMCQIFESEQANGLVAVPCNWSRYVMAKANSKVVKNLHKGSSKIRFELETACWPGWLHWWCEEPLIHKKECTAIQSRIVPHGSSVDTFVATSFGRVVCYVAMMLYAMCKD